MKSKTLTFDAPLFLRRLGMTKRMETRRDVIDGFRKDTEGVFSEMSDAQIATIFGLMELAWKAGRVNIGRDLNKAREGE